MIQPAVFTDELSDDFARALVLAREMGARGVELRNHLLGHPIATIDHAVAAQVRDQAGKLGLEIPMIASPVGKCSPDAPDEIAAHVALLRRLAPVVETLGARRIRVFGFWRPRRHELSEADRPDLSRYLDRAGEFLSELAEIAAAHGQQICLETESSTLAGTCAEAIRMLEAAGMRPEMSIVWDVNNSVACGDHPLECPKRLGGLLAHLHIKPDAAGSLEYVSSTDVPYSELLRELKAAGYEGWATVEHWGAPEQTAAGLRHLAALLSSRG